MRRLTLSLFLAFAALLCAAIGFNVFETSAHAQAMPIPDAELPDSVKSGRWSPAGWAPGQPHPGEKLITPCMACHKMSTEKSVGPGFAGLYDRVSAVGFEGKPVQQRLLDYIKDVRGTKDPYFVEMQKKEGPTPGVDMTPFGGLADSTPDADILAIIDYILRYRALDFDEVSYMRKVRLGEELVSGARHFRNGAPACTGCHTAGPQENLRGANVGGKIGHTFVAAKARGGIEKDMYSDGLFDLLSGENAPRMHRYYRDGVGHLTDAELEAVMTFFDYQLRQVGTERESNYLPIFALVLAALFILLMEPGLYANLFAKEEEPEYIDGPYQEEEHHHDDHHEVPAGYGSKPAPAPEAAPASEDKKPEPGAQATGSGAAGSTEGSNEEKKDQ
ncbi:MAG: hypothetical protein KF696_13410 [Planctomycetes bacterium]|nr:hypothetical protein [Planctomycetota bacterium]MCW8135556.1 hypothetical protein [Planctomycetota bacterium]